MVDLNADVGTIIKELLNKKKKGKKTGGADAGAKAAGDSGPMRNVIIVAIVALVATAAFIKFYYLPKQQTIMRKQSQLVEVQKKQQELATLDAEIATLQKALADEDGSYAALIEEFGNTGSVEALYSAISKIATDNNLVVVNIRSNTKQDEIINEIVREKMVNVELRGRFLDFVSFRERLMEEKPVLTIKSEAIEMGAQESAGVINVHLVLLDYSIDKAAFKEVLNHEN